MTLFRVLRGKLCAMANEIMRGRSERVTTESKLDERTIECQAKSQASILGQPRMKMV